jgi:hypothetical protein
MNTVLSKSANQLWKESGSSLPFKNWIEREKNKGVFIHNKKMEYLSVDGENENDEIIQQVIDDVLNDKKQKEKPKTISKPVVIGSVVLVSVAIWYKLYQKYKK